MAHCTRILEPEATPPLVLDPRCARRVRSPDPLPPLVRLCCALAALALPALGIALADTVHRADDPRATRAAALADPSGGAAAVRSLPDFPVRVTMSDRDLHGDVSWEVRR